MAARNILMASVVLLAGAGCRAAAPDPDPGVARLLAEERAATLSDLRYQIHLDLPADRDSAVTGVATISFTRGRSSAPLVIDFRAPPEHVLGVLLDGDSAAFTTPNGHIVLPAAAVGEGAHTVEVRFISTDDALNRQSDLLYALFVPDRASTAIPVFEQPNLKARFTLSLGAPAGWNTVSNGAQLSRDTTGTGGALVRFAETEPISTYLFTFAAGRFDTVQAVRDGRTLTMYHRESDSLKLARNQDAIFDLHATALSWLEEYTGIPYPFQKYAFFAIPAFQFGGMEHPGAVWYRAESLFLDPTASRSQELGRASLIAHETAHMWFGDLVTMEWFNDVWMKEVFANFMAAKIAGPAFPDLDLDLRFFQANHASAYGVDRTAGANPIRQDLENLREAGSLYGAIIYQKAPIVMRQLEAIVGEDQFREGLRRYLDQHRFSNATWPDLITILDGLSEDDLSSWSRAWVTEPGRPNVDVHLEDSVLVVLQSDPVAGRGLRWSQPVVVALGRNGTVDTVRVMLRGERAEAAIPPGPPVDWILPAADGVGYGRFPLQTGSRRALPAAIPNMPSALHRSVAWQALYEELLDGQLAPTQLLGNALSALGTEQEELVTQQLLGLVRTVYWRFLADSVRLRMAPEVEQVLWAGLGRADTPGRKGAWFGAIQGVTLTQSGVARLERIWRQQQPPAGLPLTEVQYTSLAEALAIRGVAGAESILDEQESRI
ncbi:MAG: M1 family aminopeptidase, partial [Gemmatimonadota bacterium]|nr:M1 family aminopeptidase [Gemmatimonadota bacterium]